MVAVEKVTMMAFNLKDGKSKDQSKLTEEQKREALKEIPSLLEFMSFMFNFQVIILLKVTHFQSNTVFRPF